MQRYLGKYCIRYSSMRISCNDNSRLLRASDPTTRVNEKAVKPHKNAENERFWRLKKPIQSIHSNKSPEKLRHSLDSWFLGFWTGCRNGILSYSSKRPSITIFLSDLVHKLRCPSTSAISCLAVLARSGERCQPFEGGKASQIFQLSCR